MGRKGKRHRCRACRRVRDRKDVAWRDYKWRPVFQNGAPPGPWVKKGWACKSHKWREPWPGFEKRKNEAEKFMVSAIMRSAYNFMRAFIPGIVFGKSKPVCQEVSQT